MNEVRFNLPHPSTGHWLRFIRAVNAKAEEVGFKKDDELLPQTRIFCKPESLEGGVEVYPHVLVVWPDPYRPEATESEVRTVRFIVRDRDSKIGKQVCAIFEAVEAHTMLDFQRVY